MSLQILGSRYSIIKPLGGGGFGQTFLANDLHLPGHPRCVVKRLQPRNTDGISLNSARRLFNSEAEALYVLGNHDQIPRLLAHFEENEQFYLAQELIQGELVSEEIRLGACLTETQTVEILHRLVACCFIEAMYVILHEVLHISHTKAKLAKE